MRGLAVLSFILVMAWLYLEIANQLSKEPEQQIQPTMQLLCAESKLNQNKHNKVFTCIMHKDTK